MSADWRNLIAEKRLFLDQVEAFLLSLPEPRGASYGGHTSGFHFSWSKIFPGEKRLTSVDGLYFNVFISPPEPWHPPRLSWTHINTNEHKEYGKDRLPFPLTLPADALAFLLKTIGAATEERAS